MPIALAGKVTFFSGELGGSDGRRPIDAKTKTVLLYLLKSIHN